eukprot:6257080-Amphidinium_carterae.1
MALRPETMEIFKIWKVFLASTAKLLLPGQFRDALCNSQQRSRGLGNSFRQWPRQFCDRLCNTQHEFEGSVLPFDSGQDNFAIASAILSSEFEGS